MGDCFPYVIVCTMCTELGGMKTTEELKAVLLDILLASGCIVQSGGGYTRMAKRSYSQNMCC